MSKSRDIADSAATINYIDNVTSDVQSQINTLDTALDNISVTSGTLTKTFAQDESASISLTSSVLAPVVSVTKEVPQSGVTNNSWDVNSTTENYTRLDSAYATTLDFDNSLIASSSFVNSFTLATTTATTTTLSPDGTKMYIIDASSDTVRQYSLSTPYSVSTASYDSVDFSVATEQGQPYGIAFNNDGTKMFVSGFSPARASEYLLSTAWDVSSASFSANLALSGTITGMDVSADGTKMYFSAYTGVLEYSLSTAFDITTASLSYTLGSMNGIYGVAFNSYGTKMYVSDDALNRVRQYNLSTAWSLSTASSVSVFSLSNEIANIRAMYASSQGGFYVVEDNATDKVFQYAIPQNLALGTGSFASADVGKTIEANSGEFVLTATDGSNVETTAPTSYDQVASGSWSMYGVVYNATDGDLELSYYPDTYNLTTAAYDSVSFSVSAQEANATGFTFSTDGTNMYVIGRDVDDINQYSLSTAFDITTASYVRVFSVSTQETDPTDVKFNPDGTKMFVVGYNGDEVNEYSLSTAWNISTATYTATFSVASQEIAPRALAFSNDGTRMYIAGAAGSDITQYTLTTGFDVTTASYLGTTLDVSDKGQPNGLTFNSTGTQLFVLGYSDFVYKYALSTAFDISTASYTGVSFSLAAQSTSPESIAFNANGTKLFMLNTNTVFQYSTGAGAIAVTGYHPVHTTNSIDSTYWTDINSMTADQVAGDGNVYYAISTDDRTTWTVIDNTDGERDIVRNNAGTWQYNSNGTYALETWVNGTTNTELATLAEAMEGASTADGFDLTVAAFVDSIDISAQETAPQGLAFNTDGTKMYHTGSGGDSVYEYNLITGFDISSATYSQSFSVASQDTAPAAVRFNNDGTKMYVCGSGSGAINEYSLSTAFDVSTSSYVQSFSVTSQDTQPTDIRFNADGTKMFIVGGVGDDVNEYNLTTGFDVSTASYSQNFSVNAQEAAPSGLAFNLDGTSMFICGSSGDEVNEYTLTTGFDISTASFTRNFSVSAQDSSPQGLAFSNDGTKMFIVGFGAGGDIYEYTTGTVNYINQMDKTQLDAVTDPNHIALGNDLDLAIVFNMTSGTTVPSSDGVAINYDANVLNKGAVLGTDYDFDAPTQNSVRITALAANNLKVRVV